MYIEIATDTEIDIDTDMGTDDVNSCLSSIEMTVF